MYRIAIQIFDGLWNFLSSRDAQSERGFSKKDLLPFIFVLIVLSLLEWIICR